jgi:UDP-4-amino-4-deoxy-L-arabinose formyltransferase/UDP-glucuronic acid dehydrogenase (UDP-4-keto-hexauronic acid decarboxylating)
MNSPRIVLFALTGFGNTVLSALCAAGFKPEMLVTRPEKGPFPHYPERPLTELAGDFGVPCWFGAEGEAQVAAAPPDVLLCATYHRLLEPALLGRTRWAINLHPSLLPRYRGANPFYWVIRNGETETGVTAHLMSAAADAGDILRQDRLALSDTETQGTLRRRLAVLAATVAVETLRAVGDGTVCRMAQDEMAASAFPRPGEAERRLDPAWTVAEAERAIRALAPFPGAMADGGIIIEVIDPGRSADTSGALANGLLRLRFRDGYLVVRVAPA